MRYAIRTFTSSRQFENFLNHHLGALWTLHSWEGVDGGGSGIVLRALFVAVGERHPLLPEVPR